MVTLRLPSSCSRALAHVPSQSCIGGSVPRPCSHTSASTLFCQGNDLQAAGPISVNIALCSSFSEKSKDERKDGQANSEQETNLGGCSVCARLSVFLHRDSSHSPALDKDGSSGNNQEGSWWEPGRRHTLVAAQLWLWGLSFQVAASRCRKTPLPLFETKRLA